MELVFAYIDPGSGSLIVQALIAGLVAIPIFFRRHIARALSVIRKGGTHARSSSPAGDDRDAGG
jgi:hypothetical protein